MSRTWMELDEKSLRVLDRNLQMIGEVAARRAARNALAPAMTIVSKALKAEIPTTHPAFTRDELKWLRKSIHRKVKTYRTSKRTWAGAGPRKSFDDAAPSHRAKPGNMIGLLEYGEKTVRDPRKHWQPRGTGWIEYGGGERLPAIRPIYKAWQKTHAQALRTMQEKFLEEIEKAKVKAALRA